MESILQKWDGEEVIVRFDRPTGAWIFIAIHSTRLGPAAGGTRMKSYPDPKTAILDALNLARGMTYKFAVINFPYGGGKAVIDVPHNLEPQMRENLLRRYGALVHQLGGLFETGPDVGTSSIDMDIVSETGSPYVFCRTPEKGGAGDSGPITAWGVFCGMQAVCEYLFGDASLKDKRILVQGAGSVGRALIQLLKEAGAEILFSDVDPERIRHFGDDPDLQFVSADAVYDTACDIFSPCALGAILNRKTIPRLRCQAVAGAANNQLAEPNDAEKLRTANILYAPDYVISIGGAMGITGIESMGWSPEKAYQEVRTVADTLKQIFHMAANERITTEDAARRIAESRLSGVNGEP